MQGLLARYPLHLDLSGPVAFSLQALLHGLQLLHRQRLGVVAVGGAVARAPQAPAHGAVREALGEVEETPEVACWWLRR